MTSLFARGSESNHTTLLINGRRLPSGFSGQYDLGQLGLVNASSVEMVRGDVSALYGGGSIAGTVNIRTDRANYGTELNRSAPNSGAMISVTHNTVIIMAEMITVSL